MMDDYGSQKKIQPEFLFGTGARLRRAVVKWSSLKVAAQAEEQQLENRDCSGNQKKQCCD